MWQKKRCEKAFKGILKKCIKIIFRGTVGRRKIWYFHLGCLLIILLELSSLFSSKVLDCAMDLSDRWGPKNVFGIWHLQLRGTLKWPKWSAKDFRIFSRNQFSYHPVYKESVLIFHLIQIFFSNLNLRLSEQIDLVIPLISFRFQRPQFKYSSVEEALYL